MLIQPLGDELGLGEAQGFELGEDFWEGQVDVGVDNVEEEFEQEVQHDEDGRLVDADT